MGQAYSGMADSLPVKVPAIYSRNQNVNHNGQQSPIAQDEKFAYGTAGFRNNADKLTFIVFRCAYLAGLRARQQNQTIGLMITASHNPACDNGVKIVDPKGDMLAADWEKYATELVNSTDDQFPTAVRALEVKVNKTFAPNAKVVCAIDTRESGKHLMNAAKAGVAIFNVEFENHGILTTPQLHYLVKCNNEPSFGRPSEFGYYCTLANAFKKLHHLTNEPEESNYSNKLVLDCANGVGFPRFQDLLQLIDERYLNIEFRNENGELNFGCGADFVKISQVLPANFNSNDEKCASFDGDADRLIYFKPTSDNKINLLDGDKIAVLLATYIKDQLKNIETDLTFGIIQTAYANGSSSRYIEEKLGVIPEIVPTGVKNLHHAAIKYDIGVYFEANGHGTVVFSEKFDEVIRRNSSENLSIQRLQLISRVINEVVGDAFADLLAVEIVLRHYGWSIEDWNEKLYKDVPNIQIKVPVEDRSIFKTTWEETTLIEPSGIQDLINAEVEKYSNSRAFIRPSGTENIVRVYAEADTVEDTEKLGRSLENIVKSL
ncbi:unnamed protein product [Caenorhabditis angaria]|uniref:Phosphoacetylglucosamine mutase n=1 Tax=Caenorhabditis angaria TaxID=860376 RepID=A0A9P1ITP9_9PELO|nr:unnamed protein product [Caenorhabditis angaria]